MWGEDMAEGQEARAQNPPTTNAGTIRARHKLSIEDIVTVCLDPRF